MSNCECGADGFGPCAPSCPGAVHARNVVVQDEPEPEVMVDTDVELRAWPRARGGQHVGVDATVIAVHKATGIAVVEGGERSQYKNRQRAVERLRWLVQVNAKARATAQRAPWSQMPERCDACRTEYPCDCPGQGR